MQMLSIASKDIWAMHMDGTAIRYEDDPSFIEVHANWLVRELLPS